MTQDRNWNYHRNKILKYYHAESRKNTFASVQILFDRSRTTFATTIRTRSLQGSELRHGPYWVLVTALPHLDGKTQAGFQEISSRERQRKREKERKKETGSRKHLQIYSLLRILINVKIWQAPNLVTHMTYNTVHFTEWPYAPGHTVVIGLNHRTTENRPTSTGTPPTRHALNSLICADVPLRNYSPPFFSI